MEIRMGPIDWNASLGDVIKQLVAVEFGVSPKDVTPEYIRGIRDARIQQDQKQAAANALLQKAGFCS